MKTFLQIAAPFVCVAPLYVMFVLDRWLGRPKERP